MFLNFLTLILMWFLDEAEINVCAQSTMFNQKFLPP